MTDPRVAEADRAIRIAEGLEEHAATLNHQAMVERQRARRIRSQLSRETIAGPALRRVSGVLTPEAEALRDSNPRTPNTPRHPSDAILFGGALFPRTPREAADAEPVSVAEAERIRDEFNRSNPSAWESDLSVPVDAVPVEDHQVRAAHVTSNPRTDRWCGSCETFGDHFTADHCQCGSCAAERKRLELWEEAEEAFDRAIGLLERSDHPPVYTIRENVAAELAKTQKKIDFLDRRRELFGSLTETQQAMRANLRNLERALQAELDALGNDE